MSAALRLVTFVTFYASTWREGLHQPARFVAEKVFLCR